MNIEKKYISNALEKIVWKKKEEAELIEFEPFISEAQSGLQCIATIQYRNARTLQNYLLYISKSGMVFYPDYLIFTAIKNPRNGKGVTRTTNTTRVADVLLCAVSQELENVLGASVAPDLKEIKRFLKFLVKEYKCEYYTNAYFCHLQQQVGTGETEEDFEKFTEMLT